MSTELWTETEPYFGFAGNFDEGDEVCARAVFLKWRDEVRAAVEAERGKVAGLSILSEYPYDGSERDRQAWLARFKAISDGFMAAADALDALIPPVRPRACAGRNCECTDGVSHSPECRLEHDAATLGAAVVWPGERRIHRLRPGLASAPWGILYPYMCGTKHEQGGEADGDTFVQFSGNAERVTCPLCRVAGSYQSAGVRG